MHLTIEGSSGVILEYSDENQNVLVPLDKNERALAFQMLMGALALLTGVTQQLSSDAKAAEMDQSNSQNPQSCDDHAPCVVVPLKARRGGAIVPSKSDIDSRGGLDR